MKPRRSVIRKKRNRDERAQKGMSSYTPRSRRNRRAYNKIAITIVDRDSEETAKAIKTITYMQKNRDEVKEKYKEILSV
jgi:hypothetical protein